MSALHAPRPFAVRLYASLIALLLPEKFRRELGEEMTLVFADLCADARDRGDRCGAFRLLAAELPDLIRLAVRERRRARTTHHTELQGATRMETLLQDLRYAGRALRKSPGFALVAVLTLALGVGANTAIFSLVNGVLLRPLALHEPERLLAIGEHINGGGPGDFRSTTPGSFFDWQQGTTRVRLAGIAGNAGTITGKGDPERLFGASSIGGLFEVLGVRAQLGRALTLADEAPEAEPVIVLSNATWQRLYGGDPSVIGRTLSLNGTPRTIVGVMPASFRFPDGSTEYWTAAQLEPAFRANRDQYFINVIGRLADGATLESARAELDLVAQRLRRDWPLYNSELRIGALPLQETIVADARPRLLVLMGAVAFVLLITCANLGNLLLARAAARRREIAIRQALGAGRTRVARQLLTESLVLALAGGAAGLAIGKGFLALMLAAQATMNLPRVEEVTLDGGVLLFTLVVSVVAGLLFGSLPAWQLARASSAEALRAGARGSGRHQWVRRALVVSELALAMVLLAGAGLLLRSFALLQRVDPGFVTEHLLTFQVNLGEKNEQVVRSSLERIGALPGVRTAAVVSQLPLTGRGIGAWYNRLDKPIDPNVTPDGEAYRVVSPEFFATVGLPLKRGRLLTSEDRRERPGIVINEALARKYYPDEDPIGKPVYLGAPDNRLFDSAPIVGVVGNTRDLGLGTDPVPTVYIPQAVMPGWRGFSYVIRTTGEPTSVAAAARAVMREIDPGLPVRNMRTVDVVLAETMAPTRWSMTLLGVFAGVAVIMAALGVFGVLSFLVTQRTRELGIRIALGAAPGAVRRMVVAQGLALGAAGLALGLAGAIALTRLMRSLLYGVEPTDPVT